jgi:hypothetical protein
MADAVTVPARIDVPTHSSSFRGGVPDVDRVLGVGPLGQQRIDRDPRGQVQAPVLEIPHARREAVAEEGQQPEAVAEEGQQPEAVVRDAPGVHRVFLDPQPGLVVEQAVQHVRRLAGGCGDDLGVERPVLVRHVGVERHARLVAGLST